MKYIKYIIFLFPIFTFANVDINKFEFYKKTDGVCNGTCYINIDADIESQSKKFLSDIRITDENNKEIKYKIIKDKNEINYSQRRLNLKILEQNESYFLIDLNNDRKTEYLNKIFIDSNSKDFRKVVNIQGADLLTGPWFNLNLEKKRGDLVYSLPEGNDLSIDFEYSNYKYLKLNFKGDKKESFLIDNFYKIIKEKTIIYGDKDYLEPDYDFSKTDGKNQIIIFDLRKENLFFDNLKLEFSDKTFHRKYILYSANKKNAEDVPEVGRYQKDQEYWVKVSSGVLNREIFLDDISIQLGENKRFYKLKIINEDNEKLNFKKAIFERFKKKIYFKTDERKIKIYYSSISASFPKYDFVLSKSEIKNAKRLLLGNEIKNQNYNEIKKSFLDDNNILIYIFIAIIIFILSFFVYKILNEVKNKTKKDDIEY